MKWRYLGLALCGLGGYLIPAGATSFVGVLLAVVGGYMGGWAAAKAEAE